MDTHLRLKTVAVVLAVLVSGTVLRAQLDVVQKYRSQYGTPVGSANLATMMRQIAGELNLGVLRKDSGNTCGSPAIACDVVCNPRTGEHWDVLGDAEGAARAQWSFVGIIDRTRCEAVGPPPPPPPGDLEARVAALEAKMAAIAAAAR